MKTAYQPKTGKPCTCKRGIERDNCPVCEGTGQCIDFAAIRARSKPRAPEGIFPGEYLGSLGLSFADRSLGFKATGEFRPPRKGEYYLSGAVIQAYRALNDLTDEFWIAVPGRVKTVTTKTWEPL